MRTIYKPKGRALEYAELALNLYTGCAHGCKYCYAPKATFKTTEVFRSEVAPRKDILKALEKAVPKYGGNKAAVLLCFTCDPYPPAPCQDVTREALEILEKNNVKAQILTKGGPRALRDFDILARNRGWSFGTTLSFSNDEMRKRWEPYAANVDDRIGTIIEAKKRGIKTWVSVEPVIDADEALGVIDALCKYVDLWKVGKLNHMPEVEAMVDWGSFLAEVRKRLKGKKYIIKKDLMEAVGREGK